MPLVSQIATAAFAATILATAVPGWAAADPDDAALGLKSASERPDEATRKPLKFFVEGAIGNASLRYEPGSRSLRRVSFDMFYSGRVATDWRFVLSDRLDHALPNSGGSDDTLNSLREAYLSWEGDGGNTVVDIGRINLRYGPAYGYNPTDFFRDGALRSITSVNPFALRENRLGTVALRAQRLWQNGSVGLTVSPKLANRRSGEVLNLDLGATNHRNRLLLTASQQFTERVSGQILAYKEPGIEVQPGASVNALVSDAAVAHFEWSFARAPISAELVKIAPGSAKSANRVAAGLTYTTLNKLSLTAEVQYNGQALGKSAWDRVSSLGPALISEYLVQAQRLQELTSRRAFLFYATQKDIGMKNLDVTGFVRLNGDDHSHLAWIELRHHWDNLDVSLQFQLNRGRSGSEYGLHPDRRIGQLVATYNF